MTINKPLVGSTALVAGTRFRPHGRVDMRMHDDMLQYEATGPFNEEVVDCLAVAQMDALASLNLAGPWASIGVLLHSAMMTPGGIARYTELMQRPKPPGYEPVATAFVVAPEVEGGRIMAPHFARIYTTIGRPFQIFETMDEARQWARSMVEASRASSR